VGCANDVLGLFNVAPYKISSLAFFGPYCLLIGYLIFRSTFLPRILGVLMALAGVGWLIVLLPLTSQLSHIPPDPWFSRGSLADAMAHRERSKHLATEAAGQRIMRAVVHRRSRAVTRRNEPI